MRLVCSMLLVLFVGFQSADAASITVSIEATVTDIDEGPGLTLSETGSGSVTYDDAFLTGVGGETLAPGAGLLALDFTIFGQTFLESDDDGFGNPILVLCCPALAFRDGVIQVLDFGVAEDTSVFNPIAIADPRVIGFNFDGELTETAPGVFSGSLSVQEVPEPSSGALLALGLVGLAARRRAEGC